MKIYEYQGKKILRDFDILTLKGQVAKTPDEAVEAAQSLGGEGWFLKAQVYSGGRREAGGIKEASSLEEVRSYANDLIGMNLITSEIGPEGKKIHEIYVEEQCKIISEIYLSCLVDPKTSRVTLWASPVDFLQGDTALDVPQKNYSVSFDPVMGFQNFHGRALSYQLGLRGHQIEAFSTCVKNVYQAFLALDSSLIEIRPLAWIDREQYVALGVNMAFDPNALYRHKIIERFHHPEEDDALDVWARSYGMNYVKLKGNIGCMVNGVGLAMATIDMIQRLNGSSASFLDVGEGATEDQITAALKMLSSDSEVRTILINIFGGIMRCDIVANGIVSAVRRMRLKIPLIVRLEGTNVEVGRKILDNSSIPIITAESLEEAVQRAVAEASGKGA